MTSTPAPDEFGDTVVAVEAGELLSGRYRLTRELGRGGMGVVWLAADTTLDDRAVAVKLLPGPLAANVRAVGRLKKEATTCLELSHPHIVRLLNFEQDTVRANLAYLVMQYVPGKTLDDLLAEAPDGMTTDRVMKWARQLAAALDFAHDKQILHRDIKPSNVMIDEADNAYLMDFGIAREAKDTMTRVTGRDSSGTLPYMSPQQVDGLNDKSNDIYALAATLYESLCGNPPFHTGDIYQQIKNRPAIPIAGSRSTSTGHCSPRSRSSRTRGPPPRISLPPGCEATSNASERPRLRNSRSRLSRAGRHIRKRRRLPPRRRRPGPTHAAHLSRSASPSSPPRPASAGTAGEWLEQQAVAGAAASSPAAGPAPPCRPHLEPRRRPAFEPPPKA
jgi:serine/threonine protein kinase